MQHKQQFDKPAISWLQGSWWKLVLAFTLPRWQLVYDRGEVGWNWQVSLFKKKKTIKNIFQFPAHPKKINESL